jgi:predicted transcriptional regulator
MHGGKRTGAGRKALPDLPKESPMSKKQQDQIDKLREIMRTKTQNELAQLADIPQGRISQFLSGQRDMNLRTVAKIMRALDITFEQKI